jgi:hypothetical protein
VTIYFLSADAKCERSWVTKAAKPVEEPPSISRSTLPPFSAADRAPTRHNPPIKHGIAERADTALPTEEHVPDRVRKRLRLRVVGEARGPTRAAEAERDGGARGLARAHVLREERAVGQVRPVQRRLVRCAAHIREIERGHARRPGHERVQERDREDVDRAFRAVVREVALVVRCVPRVRRAVRVLAVIRDNLVWT